jgi:hypothetical protein
MLRLLAALALVLSLSACEAALDTDPPAGWTSEGDRWWIPGVDTALVFRDLSTLDAMGIERRSPEVVGWAQGQLDVLYRTNPEVVDSVFAAEFMDDVQAEIPAGSDYAEGARQAVEGIKRAFYQRYNHAIPSRENPPLTLPAELSDVSGTVRVQVYVDRDEQPLAVELLEGTGTAVDEIMMRRAATLDYTPAWVRTRAGQSAGVTIPTWVLINQSFGDAAEG